MSLRRQVVFLLAIAVAGVQQATGAVDTQLVDQVLRPAAPAAVALKHVLGGELAAGPAGDDMAPEIGIAAEQAEAALHLPLDRHAGVA